MSGLCPLIAFFWLPLESWFFWLRLKKKGKSNLRLQLTVFVVRLLLQCVCVPLVSLIFVFTANKTLIHIFVEVVICSLFLRCFDVLNMTFELTNDKDALFTKVKVPQMIFQSTPWLTKDLSCKLWDSRLRGSSSIYHSVKNILLVYSRERICHACSST